MPKGAARDWMHQEWIHSHEEDQGDDMVFRPASYRFPLSRGRRSIELRPGGVLTRGGPGPTDRRVQTEGRWEVDGRTMKLYPPSSATPSEVLEIVSAAPDRLVLRPAPSAGH